MTIEIVVEPQVIDLTVDDKPVDVNPVVTVVELNPQTQVVDITVNKTVVEVIPENRVVDVISVGTQGPQGIRGPTGPSGSGSFTMIAGEIIGANAPIKTGGDNLAYIGSNLVPADVGAVVGISENAALIGEEVQVSRGELHNAGWNFAPGLIFLGDRAITSVAPVVGFTQILATVLSPTDIMGTLFMPTVSAD